MISNKCPEVELTEHSERKFVAECHLALDAGSISWIARSSRAVTVKLNCQLF